MLKSHSLPKDSPKFSFNDIKFVQLALIKVKLESVMQLVEKNLKSQIKNFAKFPQLNIATAVRFSHNLFTNNN